MAVSLPQHTANEGFFEQGTATDNLSSPSQLSLDQLSDQLLVEKFVAGENKAFDALVNRYKQKIYGYIYYQINQKTSDAEDLTQDVFLALYRQAENFKGESKFSTFLYAVAHNIVLNYYRTNKRRYADKTDSISELDNEEQNNAAMVQALIAPDCPADETINDNLQCKLSQAVTQLNSEERQLLLLTDKEGFTYEQISHILAIKVGTVRSRLNTARNRLLGLLKVNDHEM